MRKECLQSESVFLINDFLTAQECDSFVARGEGVGFASAPVTTLFGPRMLPDVRNNTRVMLDDPILAEQIFERARPFLPELLGDSWHLLGLNERWRYYRYDPGERFSPHYDGAFMRSKKEISQLTFMLYLNDAFTGGATKFHDKPAVTVQPVRGQALVFVHRKLHEGSAVLTGRKYVLRTDVMYHRC
jgi:prolyl 4-hydroxylase